MLETKEELGRGGFGEMYVYLQPAEKPCCSTWPDVPIYLKSHYAKPPSIMFISEALHTCKLIKSLSLCVVDLSIACFRFKAYINLQMFDA